ncbi:MAG TPA: DUF3693 domain-containing protein [Zeimonas sp.]
MRTVEYLDALRKRLHLPSDYAVSKVLNCSRAAVSAYRHGERAFDDTTALRVADLLELPPARVLADMAAERAKDAKVRAVWQRIASSAAAVVLGLVVGQFAGPAPASASTGAASAQSADSGLCIM